MKDIRTDSRRTNRRAVRRHSGLSGIFVFMITLTVIAGCIITGGFQSLAQSEDGTYGKYYKSITIEKDDTLWNIAEEYMTDDYDSVEEYVSVLKDMNNLNSDKILYGDKLVVAYNEAF